MPTKSCLSTCFPPKWRKQPFRPLKGPSGLSIRTHTRSHMPQMWSTRNYGTSSLHMWQLLSQDLVPAWPGHHTLTIKVHERIYSDHQPNAIEESLQHTPSLHSTSPSRQQHMESCHPSMEEVKCDIVLWLAQLQNPRRQEELQPHIQAHLLLVIKKVTALLEYIRVCSNFRMCSLPQTCTPFCAT